MEGQPSALVVHGKMLVKVLVSVAVVGLIIAAVVNVNKSSAKNETATGKMAMLHSKHCGHCKSLHQYAKDKGYTELVMIEATSDRLQQLGVRGVPVLTVGDVVVAVGNSEEARRELDNHFGQTKK